MKVTLTILTAAAATLIATAPAQANDGQRVSYADLDLTTAEGQAQLQHRADKAAWRACMYREGGMLRPAQEHNDCYRKTQKEVAVRVASLISDVQRGG